MTEITIRQYTWRNGDWNMDRPKAITKDENEVNTTIQNFVTSFIDRGINFRFEYNAFEKKACFTHFPSISEKVEIILREA